MKKKLAKLLIIATMLGTMNVPSVAFAGENDYTITPRADIKYYVHDTYNGVKMHRLWNQTQNRYDSLWTICNC